MVHLPQSVKDFGPVHHYSTFNFESVVGSIVQSVNGPNLIVAELINNIRLVQCATAKLNTTSFSTDLILFVHRLFASKRQALPKQTVSNENNFIRAARKLKLSDDHVVMTHLQSTQHMKFTLYETCWKKSVQFTVYDPSSTTQTSDSCILFRNLQSEMNCGFIVAIISNSQQKIKLIIHQVHIDQHDAFTLGNKHIVNPFVFWRRLTHPPGLVTINIEDIIVKIAYSKVKNIFHFYQYPNNVEST
ncbi:unnamed protein product [Adineta ricciae]|nr:unnamed protein product [Adineta ricciae]